MTEEKNAITDLAGMEGMQPQPVPKPAVVKQELDIAKLRVKNLRGIMRLALQIHGEGRALSEHAAS